MTDRAELKPSGGNPELIVSQVRLLGIIDESTQSAVDKAVDEALRVMKEGEGGNHSEAQAFASLLITNPKSHVALALFTAREYDLIHGTDIVSIVDSGLRRRFNLPRVS